MTPLDETPPTRDRYRIRFAKTGLLRWIGHHDLQRLWQRLLRRADLRLSMSQGFHPKPRINFPSALALGVEGVDEVIEVELAQSITPDELRQRLVDDNQPDLAIGLCDLIEQGATICRTRVNLVDQPGPHFPELDRKPMFPDLITNKNYTLTDNLFKERI